MNQLANKTALVTGGSKGLGRGIVTALSGQGARVWAMARDQGQLDRLKHDVPGVQTLAVDVTDAAAATRAMHDIRPDILVLSAGATPVQAPIHKQTWETFGRAWEMDVKATFHFGQQALLTPLAPGSIVVVMSSGASLGGSPLSGSYAGAKRMVWFLAQYMHEESKNMGLGIRFVALVPKQIAGMTDLGDVAASAYAARQGITKEQFLERMGTPRLTPEAVGQGVVSLLTDAAWSKGLAFGITGQGLSTLD